MVGTKRLEKESRTAPPPMKRAGKSLGQIPRPANAPLPVLAQAKERAKPRARSGMQRLREIRKHQKDTSLKIRKLPFQRLVRSIAQQQEGGDRIRWQQATILMLQEAIEYDIVNTGATARIAMRHSGRQTLMARDLACWHSMIGEDMLTVGEIMESTPDYYRPSTYTETGNAITGAVKAATTAPLRDVAAIQARDAAPQPPQPAAPKKEVAPAAAAPEGDDDVDVQDGGDEDDDI